MKDSITSFWKTFLDYKPQLEILKSADDPTYDVVLHALQEVHGDLYFEFCSTPGCIEFIVSADGGSALFPLVKDIVGQAPQVDNWTFFALKPKRGFPEQTRWENIHVTISEVYFLPVRHRETQKLGLHLFAPDANDSNKSDIHNALLRAIDSGLGEERFALEIQATWLHDSSEMNSTSDVHKLTELENYLDNVT